MHALVFALTAMTLSADPVDPTKLYEAHTLKLTSGEHQDVEYGYRLLKPVKIEDGKKYPLVLFLHGAGERGSDNKAQLKFFPTVMASAENREKYPCFIIAPQCHNNAKWVDVNWSESKSQPMPEKPSEDMQAALAALEEVTKSEAVDGNRIYLTGLSMGGYGSWDLAARMPEHFAAIAPICGGGDETKADKIAKQPIYVYHGDQDNAVPVVNSRGMIAAITKAGGTPKYKELPGVGHNSWDRAYSDADGVIPWMFEQVKKPK